MFFHKIIILAPTNSKIMLILFEPTLRHPLKSVVYEYTMQNGKIAVGINGEQGQTSYPVSILRKSISGRHRAVRVADGPMTARCRFT